MSSGPTPPLYGRYLQQLKGGRLRVDRAKVQAEAKRDGKYLLETSDDTLSAGDVALGYKQLIEVEEAFREQKHTLDIRPVYHRLERRIRSHVTLKLCHWLRRLWEGERPVEVAGEVELATG